MMNTFNLKHVHISTVEPQLGTTLLLLQAVEKERHALLIVETQPEAVELGARMDKETKNRIMTLETFLRTRLPENASTIYIDIGDYPIKDMFFLFAQTQRFGIEVLMHVEAPAPRNSDTTGSARLVLGGADNEKYGTYIPYEDDDNPERIDFRDGLKPSTPVYFDRDNKEDD